MKRVILFGGGGLLLAALLAALLLWSAFPAPDPFVPTQPGIVLENVTLVAPGVGRASGRTVIVRDGAIHLVAPAAPGAEMQGYLLPGLVDAHVHFPAAWMPGQTEHSAFLFLLHGVTAVRSLGDAFGGEADAARAGLAAGTFAGPRVLSCGPFLDGEGGIWPAARVVTDEASARAAVAAVAEAGYDCVKVYDELTPEALAAIRAAAHEHDLPVVGHVPRRVDFGSAGLDDAQHLRGVPPPPEDGSLPPGPPHWWRDFLRMDTTAIHERAGEAIWSDMAVTPTLAVQRPLLDTADPERWLARPGLALLPPWYRAYWHPREGLSLARRLRPEDYDWMAPAFARMQRTVRIFHGAGVPIHTGTDTNAPGAVPGHALHEELRLLVEAGLSPEQALAASMTVSAAALGIEGLGELRTGAPADLLLFGEDPTQDLAALATLETVVAAGRPYERRALEAELARRQQSWSGPGPRVVAPAVVRLALRFMLGREPADE